MVINPQFHVCMPTHYMTTRLTRSESRAYLVKVSQYRGTCSCDSHISDTLFRPSPPYSKPQLDRRRILWRGTRQDSPLRPSICGRRDGPLAAMRDAPLR